MLKRFQLNTESKQKIKGRLLIVVTIFIVLSLINNFLPLFQTWNSRLYDLLFTVRTEFSWCRPAYEDVVVHVDLDDTSIQYFNDYYLSRSYHGRVVANLAAMGVAAQLHDFILAAPSNIIDDDILINAVGEAGNSYFGLAFTLSTSDAGNKRYPTHQPDIISYLEKTLWRIKSLQEPDNLYKGKNPLITFLPLATVSRGLGFLNMQPDQDGVFRRVPLLVHYGGAYYPSLAFRVVCDYLRVIPSDIILQPGSSITLKNALNPGEGNTHDLVIPIDKHGNLRINFIGPWERMKHYHFSDIWRASEDQDEMELWREELSEKIVVVGQVTTGSSDVGSVPTDAAYPLSGINATVLHTILSESFIRELDGPVPVIAQLFLLLVIVALSFRQSAINFLSGTLFAVFLFVAAAGFLFLKEQIIVDIVVPVLFAILSLLGLQVFRALENAQILQYSEMKKGIFEKELEIGRQIQSGFFPEKLPEIQGWEIDAFFKPARQVAGDFYDVFSLAEGMRTGIVIADVCDKGVGSALFMALTRSLIRASALEDVLLRKQTANLQLASIDPALLRTIILTNNYIAETHGKSNMFATLFLAVLDHETGWLHYINCGHEPPVIFNNQGRKTDLKPTGPALGLFPDLEFKTSRIQLAPGDLLFIYTDGLTDAQNLKGDFFSKKRLLNVAYQNSGSTKSLIQNVLEAIEKYTSSAKQFDDITMLAIKRENYS